MAEAADKAPDASPEQREALILALRLSHAYQRAGWEAMRTGIALGCEEVQEQRLSALEAPPSSDVVEDTFIVLATFVLEGTVAGVVVSAGVRAIARILRQELKLARRALLRPGAGPAAGRAREHAAARKAKAERRLERYAGRANAERRFSEMAAQAQLALEEADRELAQRRVRAGGLKQRRAFLRFMVKDTTTENLVAMAQGLLAHPEAAATAVRPLRGPAPDLTAAPRAPGPQAPGLTLRAVADTDAARLLLASEERMAFQEYLLRSADPLDPAVLKDFAAELEWTEPPDVAAIIDAYQLMTAARVWAELLGLGAVRSRRMLSQSDPARVSPSVHGIPPPWERPKLQRAFRMKDLGAEKHRDYLVARFLPYAQIWAAGAGSGELVLPGDLPGGDLSREDYLRASHAETRTGTAAQEDIVIQFLEASASPVG
jgi:hypothetical protein